VQEAARAYGVNPRTIRRRIARGELAARQLVGEHGTEWRVPPPPGYTRPYIPPGPAPSATPDPAGGAGLDAGAAAIIAQQAAIIAQQAATIDRLTALVERLNSPPAPQLPPPREAPRAPAPDTPAPPRRRRWRWPWDR
jgi:hypothetical protein